MIGSAIDNSIVFMGIYVERIRDTRVFDCVFRELGLAFAQGKLLQLGYGSFVDARSCCVPEGSYGLIRKCVIGVADVSPAELD